MDKEALALALYKQGKNQTYIREKLSMGGARLRKALIAGGFTVEEILARRQTNPKLIDEKTMLELLRMRVKTGFSWRRIAKEMNFTEAVVYKTRGELWKNGKLKKLEEKARLLESGKTQKTETVVLEVEHDPRSEHCKSLNICYQSRCYLRTKCPAYQAWEARKRQADPPSVGLVTAPA